MLIDCFAPNPDAVEVHSIAIDAPLEIVYRALWTTDVGGSVIVKALMGMRSLPEFISRRGSIPRRARKITLQTVIDSGFGLLANEPGEIVLGVTGKFWRPTGNLSPFNRDSFAGAVAPGFARGIWNFSIKDSGVGTILSTETRVTCGDRASLKKFRAYWFFVRPFSGLIRRIMLRAIRKACLKTQASEARRKRGSSSGDQAP
jgi:hypothetical protein